MAHKNLSVYLNDHLAGSVAALELLAVLEAELADSKAVVAIASVRSDIETEQQQLKALMQRLEITRSPTRQAVGWLGEKITQLKLRMDDADSGDLRLFEMLEVVTLGIQGKRGMWLALGVAAVPGFEDVDYEGLVQRSEEQHRQMEALRLATAKIAFTPAGGKLK